MTAFFNPSIGPPATGSTRSSDGKAAGDLPEKEEFVEWWDQLRSVLELETGMDLQGSRAGRFRDAVRTVLRRNRQNLSTLTLGEKERAQFVEQVTSELTVGESFFLRNENHMRVLREEIVPLLLKENHSRKELRFWSAGCATGEEAYSLSILVEEVLPVEHSWFVSILGTDINHAYLERARKGSYRPWSFRQTNVHQNRHFFRKIRDEFHVHERLQKHVRFSYLNLVKDVYPSGSNGTLGLDLILFRNVAIYLKPEVTESILYRFYQALRPGGWLLLGETEVALAPCLNFELHRFPHATLFRKPISARDALVPFCPPPPCLPTPEMPLNRPIEIAGPPVTRNVVPVLNDLKSQSDLRSKPDEAAATRHAGWMPEMHPVLSIDELRRQVQQTQDSRIRARLRTQLTHRLLENAELKEARKELEVSLREDPFLIEGHLLRAGLEEEAGELDEAERSYRRVLYLCWNSPLVHFQLGRILHQQGRHSQSRQCYNTALQLIEAYDPEALVEYGDGVCYGRLMELVALMLENDSE